MQNAPQSIFDDKGEKQRLFDDNEVLGAPEIERITKTVRFLLDRKDVTDIHLTEKRKVWIRRNGKMEEIGLYLPQNSLDIVEKKVLMLPSWNRANRACTYKNLRLRLRHSMTLTRHQLFVRLLPGRAPDIAKLGYEHFFKTMERSTKPGLFLVSGATGSGKSTLLASLLQRYLDTQTVHICTVEDPVEYVLYDGAGEASQREFGDDTPDFESAIRDMLREDPDIILAGEMRDAETAKMALTAAETGHMVFTTVHASSIPGIVSRMLGMLSGVPDAEIRFAETFLGGVHLDVDSSGDSIVRKMAILWSDNNIREMLRNKEYHRLHGLETVKESINSPNILELDDEKKEL